MKKLVTFLKKTDVIEHTDELIHIVNTSKEKFDLRSTNPNLLVYTVDDMFKEENFYGTHATGILVYDQEFFVETVTKNC